MLENKNLASGDDACFDGVSIFGYSCFSFEMAQGWAGRRPYVVSFGAGIDMSPRDFYFDLDSGAPSKVSFMGHSNLWRELSAEALRRG